MAIKKWKCIEKCVWANRLWKPDETTRRVAQPNRYFKEVPESYVGSEGNKQVTVGGSMAAGVQPKLDIPPDHGKVKATIVEDHEDISDGVPDDDHGAHDDPGARVGQKTDPDSFEDTEGEEGGGDDSDK